MDDLLKLDATAAAEAIRKGDTSAEALTALTLDHARATEPNIGAFITLDSDGAMARAREIDNAIADGQNVGPLAGIPLAIKDNIHVEGLPTTCASKMLGDFVAVRDATVTKRLKEAGAVILGKVNLDEFAMGSSCETSAIQQTSNPWNTDHVPGGSSGGSAACVAAHSAFLSLGSDTGGSIRLPGAFTGTVGYKPSYGRVSRYGLVAFASSLDQVGPFSRSVRDAALAMDVLAGRDLLDSTTNVAPVAEHVSGLSESALQGKRVGVVRSYLDELQNEDVANSVNASIERMKDCGASIVDVELPHAKHGIAIYYVIASAEASSNLSRFDGVRYGFSERAGNVLENYLESRGEGFGDEVKRRIMLGAYALSAGHWEEYYGKACQVRSLIMRDYEVAFARCDLIAGPCAPFTAFKKGEISDPLAMYQCDTYTIPASMAGLCALSQPCGFDSAGLPIGLHLTAPAMADDKLLAYAHALETNLRTDESIGLQRTPF
ncbi:Asp-tRNA(Asn)/Glu-tRNA(Gln) amidotransferase subunit GatA [Planctomycetota bacterium]|nr:Asp-tRNA(Asn)/Glu-tRNA(Gln) amidotransferase subunit GatA [Planctomycetota bacterium]